MPRRKTTPPPPPEPELPNLAIALVTYKRTEEALRTIQSTCENLIYPKEKRFWFVSDDGSDGEHVQAIQEELLAWGETTSWFRSLRDRKPGQEETYYAGMGWNKVLGVAHQLSDFVLWIEDDWVLDEPLDLAPYVKLLKNREDVAAISFRILSIENDVRTKGYEGEMFLEYLRTEKQYAYSGNPILRHARMVRHYGWFHEERDPGNIETDYDSRYRDDEKDGPRIWRPLKISPWGAWKHVGKNKTWE